MIERQTKRVWVTKYALANGILQHNVEVCDPETSSNGMVRGLDLSMLTYFFKSDYRNTREEAVARAHKMRIKEIQSLKRRIKKLESMTF